ncbi:MULTISPECIES: hypothetical protein [Aphanizomenon]|nr:MULTISPECIES: hypothetical protein [Aphanizomenon]
MTLLYLFGAMSTKEEAIASLNNLLGAMSTRGKRSLSLEITFC